MKRIREKTFTGLFAACVMRMIMPLALIVRISRLSKFACPEEIARAETKERNHGLSKQ
jgi:hypothetical protein